MGTSPKSFVIKRGKVKKGVKSLLEEFKEMLYPYVALKLKIGEKIKIKDYLQAAKIY